jgi:hypothetical protein
MSHWGKALAFGLIGLIFPEGRVSVAEWTIRAIEITVLAVVCWQLYLRWGSEQSRIHATVAISLLAATVLSPLYIDYLLADAPHATPEQFQTLLKMNSRYDFLAVLLSALALVSVIVWRRSSKHFASGLAFCLGAWMCVIRTWISIMSD